MYYEKRINFGINCYCFIFGFNEDFFFVIQNDTLQTVVHNIYLLRLKVNLGRFIYTFERESRREKKREEETER